MPTPSSPTARAMAPAISPPDGEPDVGAGGISSGVEDKEGVTGRVVAVGKGVAGAIAVGSTTGVGLGNVVGALVAVRVGTAVGGPVGEGVRVAVARGSEVNSPVAVRVGAGEGAGASGAGVAVAAGGIAGGAGAGAPCTR